MEEEIKKVKLTDSNGNQVYPEIDPNDKGGSGSSIPAPEHSGQVFTTNNTNYDHQDIPNIGDLIYLYINTSDIATTNNILNQLTYDFVDDNEHNLYYVYRGLNDWDPRMTIHKWEENNITKYAIIASYYDYISGDIIYYDLYKYEDNSETDGWSNDLYHIIDKLNRNLGVSLISELDSHPIGAENNILSDFFRCAYTKVNQDGHWTECLYLGSKDDGHNGHNGYICVGSDGVTEEGGHSYKNFTNIFPWEVSVFTSGNNDASLSATQEYENGEMTQAILGIDVSAYGGPYLAWGNMNNDTWKVCTLDDLANPFAATGVLDRGVLIGTRQSYNDKSYVAIPNTGIITRLYADTSKTPEEIANILSTINEDAEQGSGAYCYFILANAIQNSGDTAIYSDIVLTYYRDSVLLNYTIGDDSGSFELCNTEDGWLQYGESSEDYVVDIAFDMINNAINDGKLILNAASSCDVCNPARFSYGPIGKQNDKLIDLFRCDYCPVTPYFENLTTAITKETTLYYDSRDGDTPTLYKDPECPHASILLSSDPIISVKDGDNWASLAFTVAKFNSIKFIDINYGTEESDSFAELNALLAVNSKVQKVCGIYQQGNGYILRILEIDYSGTTPTTSIFEVATADAQK